MNLHIIITINSVNVNIYYRTSAWNQFIIFSSASISIATVGGCILATALLSFLS